LYFCLVDHALDLLLVIGDSDAIQLAGGLVRSKGVHGGVEGRRNSKLSERSTGDMNLMSTQQDYFDDRVENGRCTSRKIHNPASAS
jgi:hypothetical protein